MQLSCLKCRTVVRRSRRYQKILNQNLADISQIKKQIRGESNAELIQERDEIIKFIEKELVVTKINNPELAAVVQRIEDTALDASKWEEAVSYANLLGRFVAALKFFPELIKIARLIHEIELLTAVPSEQFPNVAEFGKRFFGDSAVRGSLIGALLAKFTKAEVDFPLKQIPQYDQLHEIIMFENEINEDDMEMVQVAVSALNALDTTSSICLTEAEKISVRNAVQGNVTTWYKCPDGHFFGIGDCGRPVETALCPECKNKIGGVDYTALEGTTMADFG